MQIQTTTKTIENQTVEGVNFQITTFEQSITAFCDCCPNQLSGTKSSLENHGWFLGNESQFCPECNY